MNLKNKGMKEQDTEKSVPGEIPALKINKEPSSASGDLNILDKDIFIKKTFEADPQEGCSLLFQYYYTVLCSHAARFVYSQSIAEDIVSEVFEKFWTRKVYRNIKGSYRNYLYASVRNTSLNYLKREFRKFKYTDISHAENEINPSFTPYQHIKFDELLHLIECAIQSLAPKCQTVFVMSRSEGLKNSEIAMQLNITEKAVEAHITKAISKLKNTLKLYL